MKHLEALSPSSSPEEVGKTILDTMLLKSWTGGLTAILFLFCDFLLEEGIGKKKLGVLCACLEKATTSNVLFIASIYLYMQKPEN